MDWCWLFAPSQSTGDAVDLWGLRYKHTLTSQACIFCGEMMIEPTEMEAFDFVVHLPEGCVNYRGFAYDCGTGNLVYCREAEMSNE